jgi:DNA polymerase I-like protein with 3'-5' exonuclease and polymerase domains
MHFTKTGKPSVSSKLAMPYYVADYPFLARLTDYVKNQKMLTTYLAGFYKYIFEGRIRPSYGLHNTTTGRSSSRDPNGQNFPKRGKMAKRFRRAFQAPTGWVYIQVDLSQAELRIAAMISGDERMQEVYKSGGDIHRATAAGVMKISVEEFLQLPQDVQDLKRFQAKAVNFGFLYGMWWKKFREYAKTDYGIDFTEQEAAQIRELFFQTYPRLEDWHRAVERWVKKHKFVRAFNGRIRHLPMVDSPDESIAKQAVRQGINSPVQSIASDLGLMAIGLLVPYLRRTGLWEHIKVCGFIHDSIVCLVKEEYAAKAIRLVKKTMENLPLKRWFDWEPEVPIIADAEIGYNLAETYEVSPKHFSKESGNRTFKQIEQSVLTERLAKAVQRKDGKAIAEIQEKLGMTRPKRLAPKVRRRYTAISPTTTETRHAKATVVRRPKRAA